MYTDTGEDDAQQDVLRIAEEYGYGPVLDWLFDGWVRLNTQDGVFTREAATRSAHSLFATTKGYEQNVVK